MVDSGALCEGQIMPRVKCDRSTNRIGSFHLQSSLKESSLRFLVIILAKTNSTHDGISAALCGDVTVEQAN